MTPSPDLDGSVRLRPAIVLSSTEDACTVFAHEHTSTVPYAPAFPRPRAERVVPGNLVAVATLATGSEVIVWRWFDAVVTDWTGSAVTLWEPNHGSIVARPRDPHRVYRPGSRAYVSAGLPGAEWWVGEPVGDRAENTRVELDEVVDFFTKHGLWDRPA